MESLRGLGLSYANERNCETAGRLTINGSLAAEEHRQDPRTCLMRPLLAAASEEAARVERARLRCLVSVDRSISTISP